MPIDLDVLFNFDKGILGPGKYIGKNKRYDVNMVKKKSAVCFTFLGVNNTNTRYSFEIVKK